MNVDVVFLRHNAANDLALERESRARLIGREAQPDVAVLSPTSGLADVLALGFRLPGDRLAVGDLRLSDVRFDLELAHQPVDDDFQMQFAHSSDDRLPRFLIGSDEI